MTRKAAGAIATTLVALQLICAPVKAENQMGYRLMPQQEALGLPRSGGSIGLEVARAQQITDGGMTFDLMRVTQVRPGSPAAREGFSAGDQIIAVDGRVFPTLASFAAYVTSVAPGHAISVDYMPANGGPAQAQRVSVVVGAAGQVAQPAQEAPAQTGLSTGTKVAIGVGAVALLGCYEMGCFSRHPARPGSTGPRVPGAAGSPPSAFQPQNGPGQQPVGQRP